MKFGEPNFNKIEDINSSKDEYVFDINNYDLKDERLQEYLKKLKEENSPLYNDISNSIAEKELDKYYESNIPKKTIKNKIDNTPIIKAETNEEEEIEDEKVKDTQSYDLYGKYNNYISKSITKKPKIYKNKFKLRKGPQHPFDLYK